MELSLLNSLFKARQDVFALHWQKGAKSGYMPAYIYDPYMYRLHKMKGGSFKNYKDKTYLSLTDYQIQKHLDGEHLLGIYPLLKDNTSWFLAADFDKKNWIEECRKFMEICNDNNIPAYLERSRSGKGGHVWIFFEQPYPAIKSRKVITDLLEQVGLFSVFDKSSSFDRLFPNQNFLSGKGLGNLIALPFHKPALEQGNSCFVNHLTDELKPYPDQGKFLANIQKTSINHIDNLYKSLTAYSESSAYSTKKTRKLQIHLSNNIRLNRTAINADLINFLKEELNFANSEFFIKKKTGKNTWGTQPYFSCIEDTQGEVIVPRGFIGKLIRYCKQQKIDFDFSDKRTTRRPVKFLCDVTLRSHQKLAIQAATNKDFGIISAPPGSGKTIIGLNIIANKEQPALIVVHRKQLLEQWIERIQTFLKIPKNEIGRIGQGKAKWGKSVTIAMIQSLGKYIEKQESKEFIQSFGTLIIDECHHIPADGYKSTIAKLSPHYQYGLTATPFRKGNDEKLLFIYLGEKIAEIKPTDIEKYKRPRIVIRNTSLNIPYNAKTDAYETLSKTLVHDSARNKLILNDVAAELELGKRAVIITERKEHIDALNQLLKQNFETVTLSGEDSESSRKSKWKLLSEGNYQVLITTGQFFGEGTDLQNASSLFLAYPFSFKGKLIQYIGRVQRSEITPVIYDYRDCQIDYLNRLFLKRNKHYRYFDKQATLFDEVINLKDTSKLVTIDRKIKVPIADLDFRYGAVAFQYMVAEISTKLEFEVENDDLLPEFDVLKPYFSKAFKTKLVQIDIYAEYENGILLSQSANSADLERINKEIIESVKFRFVEKEILGKTSFSETGAKLLDLKELQANQTNQSIYDSEEDLLNDILKNRNIKHYQQLRFLASMHESQIMKLRFVLHPFSFVFLISGREAFHLILETLNTEEATYIWHLKKNLKTLKENINTVEKDLNVIRNKGRQAFLENPKENFSRVIHDYSDQRRGFIVWKNALEERLF